MVQAEATARYIRTSAQKAGLVLELIRGKDVNSALSTLAFARKSVAKDIEKVLRSAIANAQTKDGFGGDVDRLYVAAAYAGQGPSLKRVRPAPMGRAFRVVKRSAHLTVKVAERVDKVKAAAGGAPAAGAEGKAAPGQPKRARGAKPVRGSGAGRRGPASDRARRGAGVPADRKKTKAKA